MIEVGQTASLSKTITELDIEIMAALTGDRNPLHLDESFAQRTRFRGRIAHGLFAQGLISALIGTKLPGFGSILLDEETIFMGAVRIGDTLTAQVEIVAIEGKKVKLKTHCVSDRQKLIVSGKALVLIEGFER